MGLVGIVIWILANDHSFNGMQRGMMGPFSAISRVITDLIVRERR